MFSIIPLLVFLQIMTTAASQNIQLLQCNYEPELRKEWVSDVWECDLKQSYGRNSDHRTLCFYKIDGGIDTRYLLSTLQGSHISGYSVFRNSESKGVEWKISSERHCNRGDCTPASVLRVSFEPESQELKYQFSEIGEAAELYFYEVFHCNSKPIPKDRCK